MEIAEGFVAKSFSNQDKQLYSPPAVIQRSLHELSNVLYAKPSDFRRKDRPSNYVYTIGSGLFSTILYNANDDIAYFNGELINYEEYQRRTQAGCGGYILQITRSKYLDCYAKYIMGECKASYANCWRDCKDIRSGIKGKHLENAKISIYNDKIRLKATKTIQPHVEIAWDYGDGYLFPEIDETNVDPSLVI